MPNLKDDSPINFSRNKPGKIERFLIKSVMILTNFFWKFIDTVAHKNRKIAEEYEKVIGLHYKKEYEEFGIFKYNKVLHIGCGAYPLTEITLTSSSGIKVVGIDKNLQAVMSAKEIIRKKNLEKNVTIEHGNGINYPAGGYDVIIVSSCSTPKEKVLDNIFKLANKNSLIVVREINSAIDNIIDYINSSNDVRLIKKLHFSAFFILPVFWYALCLIKKN